MTEVPVQPVVTVEAGPADVEALQAVHADITPGYHMNKKHWITLVPDGPLDRRLVDELVTDSYLLVVGKLPRSRPPVDPQTFGQRVPAAR